MAKFYGRGTGANRGYWEFQWRDGKGRWIEMGAVGRYTIDGVTHTGRVVGGDSADSITIERRTANGQTVETTLDKINPKDIEMMDVKALLDIPEGFTEDDITKARNAELTRPTPASYPNGTKITTPDSEYTKTDQDTWSDSEGNALRNDDITARLEDAEDSSAEIPEEAELTQENILNATDGSVLSWNSKNYSRIGGKWYDDKTGKPVADRTMSKKTEGDLRPDGAEESTPTPTKAAEYEAGTKLRAEKESGDDTADLEKTADNEWKVETDSSSTDTDDATTDKLIESADYLEDLSDFLQTPTESEPARRDDKASTPAQAEDRVDEIESEIADIEDGLTDDSGENARALNEDETARLAALRTELDSVDQDLEELRGTEGNPDQDIDSAKESVAFTRNRLDELASTEETTTEPEAEARPEIETETGQPVPEYIDRVAVEARDLVEKPNLTEDDKDVLRAIHDDLSALDKAIEDSGDEGYEEDRNRISEISDNIETALAEEPEEEETSPTPEAETPTPEPEADNSVNEDVRKTLDDIYDRDDYLGQALNRQEDEPSEENIPEIVEQADSIRSELDRLQKLKDDGKVTDPELSEEIGRVNDTTRNPNGSAPVASDINKRLMRADRVVEEAGGVPDTAPEPKERAPLRGPGADDNDKIESQQPSVTLEDVSSAEELDWEDDSEEQEGIYQVENAYLDSGEQLTTFIDEEDQAYRATAYPAGSDTPVGNDQQFESREEARQYALDSLKEYDVVAANSPETFVDDDLTEGSLADPETVDESLSTPDVESVKQATQEAAEEGTLTVEEVDESADFTPSPDIEQRRTNAEMLANPQDGDILTKASGRQEQYIGGMWTPIDTSDNAPSISNDAQKKLNKSGPQTFRMGDSEVEQDAPTPKRTTSNKHGIQLRPGKGEVPDFVQLTRQDGHQETYKNVNGRWHRVLDNQGNVAPSFTSNSEMNDRLNKADQASSKKIGGPAQRPVKAPEVTPESSLTPGNTPVKDVAEPSKVLGDHILDKNPKGAPNTVLSQETKTGKTQLTGMTDGDGNAYYVGDRVTFDHFGEARSGRVTAVVKKPTGYSFTIAPDEHDIRTPEGSMPFDEWNQLSTKDKKASGSPYGKLITVSQSKMENKSLAHAGDSDTKEALSAKTQELKEQGRVNGNVVTEPEILDDVSSDRVVRDESTRIIGTTNKYGELYQRGDVVTYGPNGERGTIVHIGEADDRIRIAPNGQSALESVYHHVDTLEHSNQSASYYDKNYDLPASERVANDRYNNPVSVGDTIYRYGLPFTVKDIYPDGSKIRVVGQDWAGEQGSSPAVQFSKLIDLGVDKDAAKELSSASEHDYMPDHIQVFTGDVNDIKSVRTHDSHMMTMTRDSDGNVLDTPENRAAARSRAIGNKGSRKQTNSAVARYVAENGDSDRYEGADLQPGDYIDQGIDQAASDNLNQYINTTFGSDLVLPDNSRMLGYNKFGQYETYTKKDNLWTIDGIEGGQSMTAEEFYQYRLTNGYIPNPEGSGDQKQSRLGLTYLGDAEDHVVPKPGSSIKKTDDAKFALMPTGSVVRFTDATGREITIRKGPDGQWYKVTQSGAWSNNRKPVEVSTVPGKATYRGLYSKEVPLPKSVDTTSREAKQQNVNRQKREVERNNVRTENGGIDRIYATNTSGKSTYSGVVTEKRIAEAEQRAQDAEAQNALLLKELERLRKLAERNEGEEDTAVSASALGNRVVATRKGTDHVVAVYNRVNGNVWEHTSGRGYRREFVMETIPSTPGITYKVEENIA